MAKAKTKKSRPATEHDPFDSWQPKLREMARKSYLQYTEDLAEGAEALHVIEVALVKACKALPAVYRMTMPVTLGYDVGAGAIEGGCAADKAEALLVPVFSQLPMLLRKVREAGEYTLMVVNEQANCHSDKGPGIAAFVRANTRLPQLHKLSNKKWFNEVWNATNR